MYNIICTRVAYTCTCVHSSNMDMCRSIILGNFRDNIIFQFSWISTNLENLTTPKFSFATNYNIYCAITPMQQWRFYQRKKRLSTAHIGILHRLFNLWPKHSIAKHLLHGMCFEIAGIHSIANSLQMTSIAIKITSHACV